MTPRWLDSLLWHHARAYRRRVMRRSATWTALRSRDTLTPDQVAQLREMYPPGIQAVDPETRAQADEPKIGNVVGDYGNAVRMGPVGRPIRSFDEITRDVEARLEKPAILSRDGAHIGDLMEWNADGSVSRARGPKSFLELRTENVTRPVDRGGICLACAYGNHDQDHGVAPRGCTCPCHGKGAA